DDLDAVGVVDGDATLEEEAPVGARAAVVRQSGEGASAVHLVGDRLERGVGAAPVGASLLERAELQRDRDVLLRSCGHVGLPISYAPVVPGPRRLCGQPVAWTSGWPRS